MNFCSFATPPNEQSRLFLRMIRDNCAGAILAAMRSVLSGFRLVFMLRFDDAGRVAAGLLLLTCAALLGGQTLAARTPVAGPRPSGRGTAHLTRPSGRGFSSYGVLGEYDPGLETT